MKILDILEQVYDPQVTDRQWRSEFDHKYSTRDKQGRPMGSGFYADVYDTDDPHVVKKRHSDPYLSKGIDREYTGYWIYIKHIVDNKLWEDNPYFPRVYSFKRITDPKGNETYSTKLERLHEFKREVSTDELEFLYNKAFGVSSQQYTTMIKMVGDGNAMSMFADNIQTLCRFPNRSLKIMDDKIPLSDIDDNLLEATKIINSLMSKYNLQMDLHWGNIMVRRLPYGLQAVITDPFHDTFSRK